MITGTIHGIIYAIWTHDGCSLLHYREQLLWFLTRGGIDNPRGFISDNTSTCGLAVLAAWFEAGVQHPLLRLPYRPGTAIARVAQIARDKGAVRPPSETPVAGAVLHYHSPRPSFDDHVEVLLETPMNWRALHGGGGRPHGEISCSVEPTDIRWSNGRPLQCWYDPVALLVGTEPATTKTTRMGGNGGAGQVCGDCVTDPFGDCGCGWGGTRRATIKTT